MQQKPLTSFFTKMPERDSLTSQKELSKKKARTIGEITPSVNSQKKPTNTHCKFLRINPKLAHLTNLAKKQSLENNSLEDEEDSIVRRKPTGKRKKLDDSDDDDNYEEENSKSEYTSESDSKPKT